MATKQEIDQVPTDPNSVWNYLTFYERELLDALDRIEEGRKRIEMGHSAVKRYKSESEYLRSSTMIPNSRIAKSLVNSEGYYRKVFKMLGLKWSHVQKLIDRLSTGDLSDDLIVEDEANLAKAELSKAITAVEIQFNNGESQIKEH